MEHLTQSNTRDRKRNETEKLKILFGEHDDSERFDSTELSMDIPRQIQQKNIIHEAEEDSPTCKPQALHQSPLCTHKKVTQPRSHSDVSAELYKQRIKKLEEQRVELLHVNKQWDKTYRHMKQAYEIKVSELKAKASCKCSSNERQHRTLQTDEQTQHIQQTLLVATKKAEDGVAQVTEGNRDYDKLKAEFEVLLQQLKIYEEDYRQERAEKESLRKANEELLLMNHRLRLQNQTRCKRDYQRCVPGQLPPDV
ncbi:TNFAIP3-interacting protein 3 isoform X2 [Hyperolius riggenbachi]|uniref:TNFAIP3-interacting protein 3 isoform X2 n=1 Tax=Hyperolius riggenbachi TaxID=752182 RepID=UPI0035A2F2DA